MWSKPQYIQLLRLASRAILKRSQVLIRNWAYDDIQALGHQHSIL